MMSIASSSTGGDFFSCGCGRKVRLNSSVIQSEYGSVGNLGEYSLPLLSSEKKEKDSDIDNILNNGTVDSIEFFGW
jgi:hypothetical protein